MPFLASPTSFESARLDHSTARTSSCCLYQQMMDLVEVCLKVHLEDLLDASHSQVLLELIPSAAEELKRDEMDFMSKKTPLHSNNKLLESYNINYRWLRSSYLIHFWAIEGPETYL